MESTRLCTEEYAAEEILSLNYVYASTVHSSILSDMPGLFDIIVLAPAAKMVKKNVKKSQISIIIIYNYYIPLFTVKFLLLGSIYYNIQLIPRLPDKTQEFKVCDGEPSDVEVSMFVQCIVSLGFTD